MSLLSPDELAEARAAMAETFDTVATFLRDQTIPDAWGEEHVGGKRYEVPGRLRQTRLPSAQKEGESTTIVLMWLFRCGIDADIRDTDELTINGRKFHPVGNDKGRGDQLVQVVQLREV